MNNGNFLKTIILTKTLQDINIKMQQSLTRINIKENFIYP